MEWSKMDSRKIKIIFGSLAVVFAAYVIYIWLGTNPQLRRAAQKPDVSGVNEPNLSDQSLGQVGQAKLGKMSNARYETLDPQTKQLTRVFGFERLLHEIGDEWVMQKPYIQLYEPDFTCYVTAEQGTARAENIRGAEPAPKDAVLQGNVVIHIVPTEGSKTAESKIFLDDITFDSERSVFATAHKVEFVSQDAYMYGEGMELVYDNSAKRLERLTIVHLDRIEAWNIGGRTTQQPQQPDLTAETAENLPQTADASLQTGLKIHGSAKPPAVPVRPQNAQQTVSKKKTDAYQCVFHDKVIMRYHDKIILANQLAINNVIWKSSPEKKNTVSDKPLVSRVAKSAASANDLQAKQLSEKSQTDGSGEIAVAPEAAMDEMLAVRFAQDELATITCSGAVVVSLYQPDKSIQPASLEWTNEIINADKDIQIKKILIANVIDVDRETEIVRAWSPVEVKFFTDSEVPGSTDKLPGTVIAQKNARYYPDSHTVVFEGDVIGTMLQQTAEYEQRNIFRGEVLQVSIDTGDNSRAVPGGSELADADISHITLLGGAIGQTDSAELRMIRICKGIISNETVMWCDRLDYSRDNHNVIAQGAVEIQINAAEAPQPKGEGPFNKPFYARVVGIDKLEWDMTEKQVCSDPSGKGISIDYLPINVGKTDRPTNIDAGQIEIDYAQDRAGNYKLESIYAANGVVYEEQGKYTFIGNRMYFDAAANIMRVWGTDQQPCLFNGVQGSMIYYNLQTDSARIQLSGVPGAAPMPPKQP